MKDRPQGYAESLRRLVKRFKSSTLLVLVGSLFVLDVFIPDPLPFIDEIILGILTILIARWQSRRTEPAPAPKPPPKNVTPRES